MKRMRQRFRAAPPPIEKPASIIQLAVATPPGCSRRMTDVPNPRDIVDDHRRGLLNLPHPSGTLEHCDRIAMRVGKSPAPERDVRPQQLQFEGAFAIARCGEVLTQTSDEIFG